MSANRPGALLSEAEEKRMLQDRLLPCLTPGHSPALVAAASKALGSLAGRQGHSCLGLAGIQQQGNDNVRKDSRGL